MKKTRFDEEIFEHFKTYRCHERDLNHIVDWEVYDEAEILIHLDDGSQILYDYTDGAVRHLPASYLNRELTEEEWRREFVFRLRDKMKRTGTKQKDFDREHGISQASISQYVSGRSIPSFYTATKIAKELGCSVEELIRFPGRD